MASRKTIDVRDLPAGFHYLPGFFDEAGQFALMGDVADILARKDPVRRLELRSGDLIWFGGPSRLIFHGVGRIRLGTSSLLQRFGFEDGRINLTLRRIDRGA